MKLSQAITKADKKTADEIVLAHKLLKMRTENPYAYAMFSEKMYKRVRKQILTQN